MYSEKKVWIGQSAEGKNLYLLPSMANRHGLIAGATGTGKTITLKVLAESFSDMGVPVFLSDVKSDLSGMCQPGTETEDMQKRVAKFGIENFKYQSYPSRYWDIWGEMGHPVRVTVSMMGATLFAKLLGLTEVQTGVLNIVFKVAEDHDLTLLDLKDLRAMLQYVGENRAEFTVTYGNVSAASIGAIQRALLAFEAEAGDLFFGEPALDIRDWMRTDLDGRGYINILNSTKLIQRPTTYATFLLWMLTELFERLPEVGDLEKPRMIFFFDEAHLLFDDISKSLLQKLIQVVKLIRSKGVGVYFITQSPSDIPNEVLAQLSNRIQHALRAYTPAEQKAIRATAAAFRQNDAFDTQQVLMELGVGEALISCLDEKGIPTTVERAKILPPQSKMGPADEDVMQSKIRSDEFDMKYREMIDRESAYEIIQAATLELERMKEEELAAKAAAKAAEAEEKARLKAEEAARKQAEKEALAAEKAAEKEALAAQKAAEREALAAEKARLKAEEAARKQAEKEALAAEKEKQKAEEAKKKLLEKAAKSATSSVINAVGTNVVNAATGGKKTDTATIAKRAASAALKSVMRSGSTSLINGLLGKK
ncbi:MAG: DUF853 domain-containing protein [Dorea sp.]|nr:DUF853 domain-containing protein [Dorea sp.]